MQQLLHLKNFLQQVSEFLQQRKVSIHAVLTTFVALFIYI